MMEWFNSLVYAHSAIQAVTVLSLVIALGSGTWQCKGYVAQILIFC